MVTPSISQQQPARTEVLALVAAIEAMDGAPPLSDQALAQLGSDRVLHLVARDGERLVGYAQLDGDSLELAAEPQDVPRLLAATDHRPLLVWSHGRGSRLIAPLEQAAFARERELHQLRRPLDDAHPLPPEPALDEDVTVRTFVPGTDDAAWLALNSAAFAAHPEQGAWDESDLRARFAQPWFDPAGFLLAERAGVLLGFHWTKIHGDGLGEVYVLGVSPDAQGLGLGRALLVRGLRHLADRGCPAVLLYVDGDNAAARHLYERDGFVTYDLDVQWRRR